MKTTRVITAAAAALLSTAAFADGFTASGYLRTGIESVITDDGSDADPSGIFKTAATSGAGYHGGHNLGLGADRLRVTFGYSRDNAGVKFRYQHDDFTSDWLNPDDVKFAFGYVNLFDRLLTVEAGNLNGGYTATHGDNEYAFGGRTGARIAVFPVEGLVFDAVLSTKYLKADASGTGLHASKEVLSASAAYTVKDVLAFQAGYALKGEGYFGFDLLSVENLGFTVEAKYLKDDISEKLNKKGKAVNLLSVTETVSYSIDPVKFGIVATQNLTEDNGSLAFYPYVSVGLDDVLEGLSAGIDAGYVTGAKKAGADVEDTVSVTPEVTLAVAEGGKIQAYYTFSKSGDVKKHVFGLGVRYDF